jgi:hypothetical protein
MIDEFDKEYIFNNKSENEKYFFLKSLVRYVSV